MEQIEELCVRHWLTIYDQQLNQRRLTAGYYAGSETCHEKQRVFVWDHE